MDTREQAMKKTDALVKQGWEVTSVEEPQEEHCYPGTVFLQKKIRSRSGTTLYNEIDFISKSILYKER
jgi:hypothetical protein